MTLQTRLTIVEKDVVTLRSRMDNADVEREHIKRQIADLRAETRGWAEITVRVDQKMDAAADLMQLMYADIRQTKETLAEHGSLLREHGSLLREHGSLLREQGSVLQGHGDMLREQGSVLQGHGDMLREHGSVLQGHGDMLRGHGDMLREILARLDGQHP